MFGGHISMRSESCEVVNNEENSKFDARSRLVQDELIMVINDMIILIKICKSMCDVSVCRIRLRLVIQCTPIRHQTLQHILFDHRLI